MLDSTFDGDGKLTTPFGTSNDEAMSVALQPDGKVVVAGYGHNGSNYDFAVARYNVDGTLDTTFDGDGKLTTAFGSSTDEASAVAIQPDGKVVVAGHSNIGGNLGFAVARYNSDGSLDTSFDGDGKLTTAIGSSSDGVKSLVLQSDGKIILAGYSNNGSNVDFGLVRYNPDGSLDTTFDGDGKLTTPIGASNDLARSLVLQPDGKIVVAGFSSNGANDDFSLARYNPDGSLDTSFDGDGKLTIPVGTANDVVHGLALQPNGQIVVAGYSFSGGQADFALVRLGGPLSLSAGSANEGSTVTVGPTSTPWDPAVPDIAAGLHFALDYTNDGTFDLGNGTYAGSGTSSSAAEPARRRKPFGCA